MGQKVNPIGLRTGYIRTWKSQWFKTGQDYINDLHEDLKIRTLIFKLLKKADVSDVTIERPQKMVRLTIHTARPGVVIGRKGGDLEKVKEELAKITKREISLNIVEIRKPEIDATLIAQKVSGDIMRRVAFRRAMKRVMQSAMRLGAKGIRINVSGRLGGAEIARMEWAREGRVPLHTIRADIDYGTAEAHTTYGVIGIKVWVYKGDILTSEDEKLQASLTSTPVAA